MNKRCTSCGSAFYADADWKRECFACWKKHKFWESERGAELEGLRARVRFMRATIRELERRPAVPDWVARHRKWLIQKLHPDKHNGSPIAHEVCSELNKMGDE